jgi:general secretion pathway protein A
MYKTHFQFSELPFGVTPDPQFYYSNAVYREAWATLRYGIEGRKGFIVIAGEAGTGKTTLLRKALHEFPPNIKSAYIPNTLISFNELLRLILKDLGLSSASGDKSDMMEQLNQYLLDQFHSGNLVALLIDESQDLSLPCLEELRLLGNLETDKHKLLQIVLVGQAELERKLNQPELLQLKQRIVLRCWLRPVEAGEVGSYIESRLQAIGRTSAEIFDPEAIDKIAFYSKGIPRLINIICDNALLTAFAASKFKVSAAMIDEVADDLLIDESLVKPEVHAGALPKPVETKESFESAQAEDMLATEEDPLPAGIDDRLSAIRIDSKTSRKDFNALRPIFATLAAIVALSGLAAFFYSQRGTVSVSDSQRNVRAKIVTTKPQAIVPAPHAEALGVSDQKISSAPQKNATNGTAVEEIAAAEQFSKTPIAREVEKIAPPQRGDKLEAVSNSANFVVVGASFVRANPSANAEILTTLKPGTSIEATGPAGEYYLVRSIGTRTIRGYVHREDAFFERKR